MRDVDTWYSIKICERVFTAKCHLHRYETDVYDLKLCRRGRRRYCRALEIFGTFKQVEQHRAHVPHYFIRAQLHTILVPRTTTYTLYTTYLLPRTAHIECIVCCKL